LITPWIFPPIHPLTDALSLLVGYEYYQHLKKKYPNTLTEELRLAVIIGAVLGAFIGSRLLAALEHIQDFLHPSSMMYYYSNKTIVGGLIGGIVGVEMAKWIKGIKESTGDLFVFPLIVGMVIGRVGCFIAGVSDSTVGNASHLPWAMDQGDGILRHSTSLYEILFLGGLFVALKMLSKNIELRNGVLFRIFIVAYLLFRFAVEFIKPVEHLFIGLSAIQIACVLVASYYSATLIFFRNRLTNRI
jgi:phosphatidylglycerol:prolipoprotein diacylglycerol transferase